MTFFYKNTNRVEYNICMAIVSLAVHHLENRLYMNSPLYSFSLFKNGNIQQNRQVHFQSRLIDQCSQIFKMHKSKAALAFQMDSSHSSNKTNFQKYVHASLSFSRSLSLSRYLSLSVSTSLYLHKTLLTILFFLTF